MSIHEEVVAAVIPGIYADTEAILRGERGVGLYTDPSHSKKCGMMTLELLKELRARHLPARRELHESWLGSHFIIVHTMEGEEPSPDDIVTELNPWQHGPTNRTGYLHGNRTQVNQIIARSGAPMVLRSLNTITISHTTSPTATLAHAEFIPLNS